MKLGCRAIENNQSQIIRTEYPGLEGWEDPDGVLHQDSSQDLPYASEIARAKLISRHHDDNLAGGSELERTVDWPRILLILVTFESLRHNIKAYVKGL